MQTNVVETTTYRQDHPYIGLAAARTKTLNALPLSQEEMTYVASGLGGTRYFVGLGQSVLQSNDLSGTALPKVVTTYQYDVYGNPTQVKVATSDGSSRTTTNTYSNDTANWLLGRLTAASVTTVTP